MKPIDFHKCIGFRVVSCWNKENIILFYFSSIFNVFNFLSDPWGKSDQPNEWTKRVRLATLSSRHHWPDFPFQIEFNLWTTHWMFGAEISDSDSSRNFWVRDFDRTSNNKIQSSYQIALHKSHKSILWMVWIFVSDLVSMWILKLLCVNSSKSRNSLSRFDRINQAMIGMKFVSQITRLSR